MAQYTDLALWRVINFCKESLCVISLSLLPSNLNSKPIRFHSVKPNVQSTTQGCSVTFVIHNATLGLHPAHLRDHVIKMKLPQNPLENSHLYFSS